MVGRKNTNQKLKRVLINRKSTSGLVGTAVAVLSYVLFGIVTAIIPNRFFTRMTSFGIWEQVSLLMTSLLLGIYFGLTYYARSSAKSKVCATTATAGGVFGFLTFGCSICNKILVFLLGVTGIFAFFEPIRPFLGIVSIAFLGFAIFTKARSIAA